MSTYKVLQDIEAEDKLLGPLTLKQFIFAIVTIAIGFLNFKLATTTQLSVIRWPFVIVLFFPMVIFGFLAAPISRDQPNDVWLLARIRFLLKPHVRIWNQDGISQLVTITVPKKIEQIFTNGLNQIEVKSRLSALANTLDSRGWAVKNVDVNMFAQPGYIGVDEGSDRLVAASSLPSDVQALDVHASDDILDMNSNATAQHLDQMVQDSTAAHRKQLMDMVRAPEPAAPAKKAPPEDYWFMNQPATPAAPAPNGYTNFGTSSVVAPGAVDASVPEPTAEEKAFIAKVEAQKQAEPQYSSHIKTIQPLGHGQPATPAAPAQLGDDNAMLPVVDPVIAQAAFTPAPAPIIQPQQASGNTTHPAILNLANNDDLNVATIARQAQRLSESDGEVVISLH